MGRDVCFGAKQNRKQKMTQWENSRVERSRQHFIGSSLVSILIEQNPYRFKNRPEALKFAKTLFREGLIRSIYETTKFEDSDQLYTWSDTDSPKKPWQRNSSHNPINYKSEYRSNKSSQQSYSEADDKKILEAVKQKLQNKSGHSSVVKRFLKDLEEDLSETKCTTERYVKKQHFETSWLNQRTKTALSEDSSNAVTHSYRRLKASRVHDRVVKSYTMASQNDTIPEEDSPLDRTVEGNSIEIELATNNDLSQRWHESHPYSDNEKQLIEEMNKMKSEHQETLKNYEERIEKLMTRMHELKGIAEMLESSGNKPAAYGMLPTRTGFFNFLDATRLDENRPQAVISLGSGMEVPPPLPPRPGRTNRIHPSKPIVQPRVKMKTLDWSRIILKDSSNDDNQTTIWHTMNEPKVDGDEVERLFQSVGTVTGECLTLYDDMAKVRGKTKQQLVTLLDVEKSRRAVYTMKCLPCTMNDVINAVSSLDTSQINPDRFAELLELLGGGNEIERVQFHVRRKSPSCLDYPEYLLLELTKVAFCKERMDFIRFRHRIQWHLFETEQQLKELRTACEEITNSRPLRNLLETLLAVGNYLNGGLESGQADGYCLDILNKLKEIQDRNSKGNLLDFVLKLYCQFYEVEDEIGCPTKFKLPEPSNMRHAAQVSFDNIQEALSNMKAEVKSTREKFLTLAAKENSEPRDNLWATAENFITSSLDMIGEEEKLLQHTRECFLRTTSYFLFDEDQNNPQPFFHLWAVFLHDCKYHWKLAHRKIGKERFEIDFKRRGQMSTNSLMGYDHFRANMMQKLHNGKNSTDVKTSTMPNQKKINNWMEPSIDFDKENKSVVASLPHQELTKSQLEALQQSPSPKLLTSEPPASASLHKPLPKAPVVANNPEKHLFPHNYENQEDIEKAVHEPAVEHQTGSGADANKNDVSSRKNEKHPPFSFKWLKRDPGKRNNSGDSRSSADSNKADVDVSKRQVTHTVTPFTKFKNTVTQKFSAAPSAPKRRNDNIDVPSSDMQEIQEPVSVPVRNIASFTPLKVTIGENEINPYETSLGREQRTQIAQLAEVYRYGSRTGSAERRTRVHGSDGKVRNGSVVSTEYATLYHTPPFSSASIDKDGYSSPQILRPFAKSDINNNTPKHPLPSSAPESNQGVRRTRAPIALGSNLSISDAYGRQDDRLPQRNHEIDLSATGVHSHPHDLSSTSFHQAPVNVPSYNAKRVHNYENQGRFESLPATRHRAEPVPMLLSHSTDRQQDLQNHTFSLDTGGQNIAMNVSKFSSSHQGMLPTKDTNGTVANSIAGKTPETHPIPNGDVRKDNVPVKPLRNFNLNLKDSKRESSQFNVSLERQGQKNTPSISTLINRFEKKQNQLDLTNDENIENRSLLTMTSTPVTHKSTLGFEENDDPPPVPPRSDQSFQDHYPTDSLESRSSRGKGRQLLNGLDNSYNSNTTPKQLIHNDQHFRSPVGDTAPTKFLHVRQETGLSDQDDSYKDRLRKAANSSMFDRHTKFTPQYNKQGNKVQFNTPQYNRQNSQTSSLPYNRQNSNQSQTTQGSTRGPASQTASKQHSQMPFVRNLFGTNEQQQSTSRGQQNPQSFQQSYPEPYSKDNVAETSDSTHPQVSSSTLAVVKPTVVNRGSVTFMEI